MRIISVGLIFCGLGIAFGCGEGEVDSDLRNSEERAGSGGTGNVSDAGGSGGDKAGGSGADGQSGGADGGSGEGASGGDTSGSGSSSQGDGGGGGVGGEETGSGGAGLSGEDYEGGPCPETAPTVNTPCEPGSGTCSYGTSNEAGCRQRYTCHATGQWLVEPTIGGGCPQPAGECETMPEGSCERAGERCTSGESICTCNPEQTESCGGAGCQPIEPPIPQQWKCEVPRVQEGCPKVIPNSGTSCDDPASGCLYGAACTGLFVACEDGYYDWQLYLCP